MKSTLAYAALASLAAFDLLAAPNAIRLSDRQAQELKALGTALKTRALPAAASLPMPQGVDATLFGAIKGKRSRYLPPSVQLGTSGTDMMLDDALLKEWKSQVPLALQRILGVDDFNATDTRAVRRLATGLTIQKLEVIESFGPTIALTPQGSTTAVPYQVRTMRYKVGSDALCGPTLVLRRDQTLILGLENKCDPAHQPQLEWVPDAVKDPSPEGWWTRDAPDHLFSTNLHTHGLHVSPGDHHDNVFLTAEPQGNTLWLYYPLPENHSAGTFWYHAHHHGSVAYQLAGGMAGAIIIKGSPNVPTDLESIEEIRNANHIADAPAGENDFGRVMLLQQFLFQEAVQPGINNSKVNRLVVDPASVNDRVQAVGSTQGSVVQQTIVEGMKTGDTLQHDLTALNGQPCSDVSNTTVKLMQQGSVERWRFIHAGRESSIKMQWFKIPADGSAAIPVSDDVRMFEIATDGMPTGRLDSADVLELFPGYRSDVLITFTKNAKEGDVYALLSEDAPSLPRPGSGKIKGACFARVEIKGKADATKHPDLLDVSKRKALEIKLAACAVPPPADDPSLKEKHLSFLFRDVSHQAQPDVFPVFGASNLDDAPQGPGQGQPYAQSGGVSPIRIELNQTQKWTLHLTPFKAAADLIGPDGPIPHPFHIHVNPFWVPGPNNDDSKGVWRDTLAIWPDSPVTVRFTPTDYAGRSVFHCHILDHEDQGMMRDVVIHSAKRGDYPQRVRLVEVRHLSAFPPVSPTALPVTPGKASVIVFLKDELCPHCMDQLKEISARLDTLADLQATVTVVAATPISSDALKKFNIKLDPKQIFADTAQKPLFKPGGMVDAGGSKLHGVLVFDKNAKLRYHYSGTTAMPDTDEIDYALMELQQPGSAKGPSR